VRRLSGRPLDPKAALVGLDAATIPKDGILEQGPSLFPRIDDEKPR